MRTMLDFPKNLEARTNFYHWAKGAEVEMTVTRTKCQQKKVTALPLPSNYPIVPLLAEPTRYQLTKEKKIKQRSSIRITKLSLERWIWR